jgi:hypothetical protein|tara:strand:+ start:464 stop:712 length:249 start_codon:yes stop_codon:yes gene_type:complete
MRISYPKNKKKSSNLATINISLEKSGEVRMDMDYIKPVHLLEALRDKHSDYANAVLLSSIIYDIIGSYETMYDKIKETINMS